MYVLSAGAAKAVVTKLAPTFTAETGTSLDPTFSAVGAMREALLAGAPCDLLVLTRKLIAELVGSGHLRPEAVSTLGRVPTGIAVRADEAPPDLNGADALRVLLLGAPAIFTSDLTRSTGGIHFRFVLCELGIYETVRPRLREFPNGAIALAEQALTPGAVGCSQLSEINYTEGVTYAGPLPDPFGLTTPYDAAVTTATSEPELATRLLELLTTQRSAELRQSEGFQL
jgi:molybdate transport system substrate-binding protein